MRLSWSRNTFGHLRNAMKATAEYVWNLLKIVGNHRMAIAAIHRAEINCEITGE
jgi:hypothetical protein